MNNIDEPLHKRYIVADEKPQVKRPFEDVFPESYRTNDIKQDVLLAGIKWSGPFKLIHGYEVRIAVLPEIKDNDGYGVEIYVTAMPAKFYTVKAVDSHNSVNEAKPGFMFSTGSDCLEWALQTAKLINEGMITLHNK